MSNTRDVCLRINNIPLPDDEVEGTSEYFMVKIKEVTTEAGLNMPDLVVDRAHCVGQNIEFEDGFKQQAKVRFTTWHHRTLLYRNRKTVNFVFPDVNCAL